MNEPSVYIPFSWIVDFSRWQRKPRTSTASRRRLGNPPGFIERPCGPAPIATSKFGSKKTRSRAWLRQ
jgi:hypothetical protein